MGSRSVHVEGLAVTGLNSGLSDHLSMKEIITLCLVQETHKISQRVGLILQLNCLNSVQKYVYTQQNPLGWWSGGVGLGMDNIFFVMCVAFSKYGNAYPAFPKEYGFPYHLTPKILKEIIAEISRNELLKGTTNCYKYFQRFLV